MKQKIWSNLFYTYNLSIFAWHKNIVHHFSMVFFQKIVTFHFVVEYMYLASCRKQRKMKQTVLMSVWIDCFQLIYPIIKLNIFFYINQSSITLHKTNYNDKNISTLIIYVLKINSHCHKMVFLLFFPLVFVSHGRKGGKLKSCPHCTECVFTKE